MTLVIANDTSTPKEESRFPTHTERQRKRPLRLHPTAQIRKKKREIQSGSIPFIFLLRSIPAKNDFEYLTNVACIRVFAPHHRVRQTYPLEEQCVNPIVLSPSQSPYGIRRTLARFCIRKAHSRPRLHHTRRRAQRGFFLDGIRQAQNDDHSARHNHRCAEWIGRPHAGAVAWKRYRVHRSTERLGKVSGGMRDCQKRMRRCCSCFPNRWRTRYNSPVPEWRNW